jgi:hypothetical protein
MPRDGRPAIGRRQERQRQIRPVATDSPMPTYRLADFNGIFNLYLNAVEMAARNASSAFTVDGRSHRDGVRLRAVQRRT